MICFKEQMYYNETSTAHDYMDLESVRAGIHDWIV